ncbi:MAG: transcription elongation factor [Verrucomicrobia bacterium]|nr:transcription elongation factor [Verrucomicrobiota bacterium]
MSAVPDKHQLRERVLAELRAAHSAQVGAANLARDEAISEESRPENKYDTHSIEAGYLAEGQARQAAELEASMAAISSLPVGVAADGSPVTLGAVVEVRDSRGTATRYYVCPKGGGVEVVLDGQGYLVITPASPMGSQLIGRHVGDPVQPPGRRANGSARISAVY